MAQVSVLGTQVAVMVTACPYAEGFGEMERLMLGVCCTVPKLAVGITPLGGWSLARVHWTKSVPAGIYCVILAEVKATKPVADVVAVLE